VGHIVDDAEWGRFHRRLVVVEAEAESVEAEKQSTPKEIITNNNSTSNTNNRRVARQRPWSLSNNFNSL
jgi:hypothetical protein